MEMLDCTNYSNVAFLQLLKSNPLYLTTIAEAENWEEVVDVINSLNIKYTDEQLNYVKYNQW